MRIETGHICKNCCYYTIDDGDTTAYCCLEPLYTSVRANHPACDAYVSDIDDDNIFINKLKRDDIFYDEEDDNLDDFNF